MEWLTNFINKFTPLSFIFVASFTVFIIWLRAHLTEKEKHRYWLKQKRAEVYSEFFKELTELITFENLENLEDPTKIERSGFLGGFIIIGISLTKNKVMMYLNNRDREALAIPLVTINKELNNFTKILLEASKKGEEEQKKAIDSAAPHWRNAEKTLEEIGAIFDRSLKSNKWH